MLCCVLLDCTHLLFCTTAYSVVHHPYNSVTYGKSSYSQCLPLTCYSDSTPQINNLKAPSANLLALVACQSLEKANYAISATIEKPLEIH